MKIHRILAPFALLLVGVVTIIGSGGGGGSGSIEIGVPVNPDLPPEPPPVPQPEVDITVANAQDVAATVIRATELLFDVTAKIGGQILPALPSAPDLLSGNSKFELFDLVDMTGAPVTEVCDLNGTVTVSDGHLVGYGNDPLMLAEDDIYNLVFTACDDGDGYSLEGAFGVLVRAVGGDVRSDLFQLSYYMSDLDITISSDAGSYRAENYLRIDWDSLAFPVVSLANEPYPTLTSQTDTFFWSFGGQLRTIDTGISPVGITAEDAWSRLSSNSLGGFLLYETIVPIEASGDRAPNIGEVLVSEQTDNGTIRMVIESSTSVRLEIDADGDGVVDDIQFTTWVALQD